MIKTSFLLRKGYNIYINIYEQVKNVFMFWDFNFIIFKR